MRMRSAGILLPITALPSPYGIGTMGGAARDFILFLQRAGQRYWQILPIGPTSYGDSPYQSFSSFAGNPYLIDLDDLRQDGLLELSEYADDFWGADPCRIDYALLYRQRFSTLQKAVGRLDPADTGLLEFCQTQAYWLEDYALFMALKDYHGGISWHQWPEALQLRRPEALGRARSLLQKQIHFWKCVQYLFFRQWGRLKEFANSHGVLIIGDLPIYVANDSADVWANPEQFQLDAHRNPTEVSGCPPDGFSADGQMWGNPLFDWERMRREDYRWWLRRIHYQLQIFDVLRIDHFRGFDAYYAIPADGSAKDGHWEPGPGIDFFRTVASKLGQVNIIAEDLGFLTESVYQLLRDTGFPGMKILQFAFDSRDTGSGYLPHCYPQHCVVYTGTHDNDTILGWMASAPKQDVERAIRYLRLTPQEGYHWGMMRSAWASVADLTIIQLQDVLGLGSQARINTPSTIGGNWVWRCRAGSCSDRLADQLHQEMELYGRL